MAPEPAFSLYRVERQPSDDGPADWRQNIRDLLVKVLRRGRKPGVGGGDRFAPITVHDVVRILDRAGTPVSVTEFDIRFKGEAFEAQVIDDLLRKDVASFREKYAIAAEPAGEPERAHDGDSGRREGDIGWGEVGQG